MPRGPTAYFLFAESVRAEVQAELQAQQPDGKVSVATLGKAIGEKWRSLSDEQKQTFKNLASERTATEHTFEDGQHIAEEPSLPHEATLPISLVKKIMMMDDEVSRVGSEGLRAVAAATEAFLKLLASQALSRATREKRKNFRFDDLLAVSKQDRRMGIMGLSEIFQEDPLFQEARSSRSEPGKASKKAGNIPDIEGDTMPRLTSFFPQRVAAQ